MKVLILSDPSAPHTVRWVNSLFEKGVDVQLFGLSQFDLKEYNKKIKIYSLKTPSTIKAKAGGSFTKIIYLTALPNLKKVIREFQPDIVHAHYAASYGLLGVLTNFHPLILSVWGIDILTFPKVSSFHSFLVKLALRKSDKLLATSNYLKNETNRIFHSNIITTPFGIDTTKFKNLRRNKKSEIVTVGVVKSLEGKYGIDLLIDIFAKLVKELSNLRLIIVGGGSLEEKFKMQVKILGISDYVEFMGRVSSSEVVEYHNMLDIAVYLSSVESFGVSVLESSACEIPVLASDIGGLREVVINNETGYLVRRDSKNEIYKKLKTLILNPELRKSLGQRGREFVKENFNWDDSVKKMIDIYTSIMDERHVDPADNH